MQTRKCPDCGLEYVTTHEVCPRCALRVALEAIAGGTAKSVESETEPESEATGSRKPDSL